MKKLLSVSLVALLAVSPMMASAATALTGAMSTATAVQGDDDTIVSATYVKGAYNAAAGEINKVITDIDVTAAQETAATAVNGNTKMLQAGASVAENLGNIDTKIGSFQDETSGGIITNANSVSSNLKALEGVVLDNEANIGNMNNLSGNENSLVEAIEAVRSTANTANGKDSIVVYSGWNSGGAPAAAAVYTTKTAADAQAEVTAANN